METKGSLSLLMLSIITFLSLFITDVQAKEIPVVSGSYHDELKLLDSSTINNLEQINDNLYYTEEAMGAEIMVVTIEDLEGQPAFDYSVEFFNKTGVGDEKERNGVLVMLAKEGSDSKDKFHVEVRVGYGLEGALNDGKVGRMIDNTIMPSIGKDDVSSGINSFIIEVASEIENEYDISVLDNNVSFEDYNNYEDTETKVIFITGIAIVVLLIIGVVSYAITGDSTILYIMMMIIDVLLSSSSSSSRSSSRKSGSGSTGGGGAGRSS